MNYTNIPSKLKNDALFCMTSNDKTSYYYKKPVQINGDLAKANDPTTFAQYNDVINALKQPTYYMGGFTNAIGILLQNKLCCIDIDHCINENGAYTDVAKEIMAMVPSYTEISQSGTGLHIFMYVDIENQTRDANTYVKANGIEIYFGAIDKRFIAITGNCVNGSDVNTISNDVVMNLLNKYMQKPVEQRLNSEDTATNHNVDIDTALKKALQNDAKFNELWHGIATGYESQSNYDLALCTKIAFYCSYDPVIIDALFMATPYYATKDNEHIEKWARADYKQMTIGKAIQGATTMYKATTKPRTTPQIDFNASYELMQSIKDIEPYQQRIATGFEQLDNILNGGFESGLITIGALPSVGKTTFALQIADNVATGGKPVLYVCLEQSARTLMCKSLSRLTNNQKTASLNCAEIENKTYLQDNEKSKSMTVAMYNYKKDIINNLTFVGVGTNCDVHNANDVISYIEQIKDHTGIAPFVVIDYMQLLSKPTDAPNDAKSIIDANIKILQSYANNNDLTIVGIASMNRGAYQQDNATMGVYNGTSMFEYSSQTALNLIETGRNDQNTMRYIDVAIVKNKNGNNNVKTSFYYFASYNKFVERAEQEEKPSIPTIKFKKK